MIINYPTGLYKQTIPRKPSDVGNVTFTISSTSPPRSDLLFNKLSVGIASKQRAPINRTPLARRSDLGELAFTITKAQESTPSSGAQQFRVGEVLEFLVAPQQRLDPMLVSPATEVRHGIYKADLAKAGLSADDIELVSSTSYTTQLIVQTRLNEIKQQRANADLRISSLQISLNELDKAKQALLIVQESGGEVTELLAKVTTKYDGLVAERTAAIAEANQAAALAVSLAKQLQALSAMVT